MGAIDIISVAPLPFVCKEPIGALNAIGRFGNTIPKAAFLRRYSFCERWFLSG